MKFNALLLGIFGALLGFAGLEVDTTVSSVSGLVLAIPLISNIFISLWNLKNFWAWVVTFVVGILLSFIASLYPEGITHGQSWYEIILTGIFIVLSANGVWNHLKKSGVINKKVTN